MDQPENLPKRKSLSHSQCIQKVKCDKQQTSIYTDWDLQFFTDEQIKAFNSQKEQDVLLNKQTYKSTVKQDNFMKVKDINQHTKQYSVLVKVLKSIQLKSFNTNMNYVKVTIADQTASAHGFFKGQNCQFFKVGNVLAIKKGLVKIIKGHIQLQLSDFGRIIEKNSKLEENAELNISMAYIKEQHKRYNRNNDRKTEYSRKKSQYKFSYGQQSQRYGYDARYKKQRYDNGNQSNFNGRERDSKRYYQGNGFERDSSRKVYYRQDARYKQERNKQQRHPSKESISFFIKKRSFSREKSLTSYNNFEKKNKYFKIKDIRETKQLISVVGRVKRQFSLRNSQYKLVILQDQTGSIKVYLPGHKKLPRGDIIVVIHNLRCKFDRQRQIIVLEGGVNTIINEAKQNLQPLLSMYHR